MTRNSFLRIAAQSASVFVLAAATVDAQGTATRKVALNFKPTVGTEPFACGKSFSGVGTSNATITPSDYALYVHDVKLLTATGAEVPMTLDQDGVYQNGNVALLDFEDGTGACSNGNAATHTAIRGTAPEGKYVGVKFTVGVPFERNHADLTTQPSPLSVSRMFWAWATGHKFVRFDAKTAEGKSWVLHLGSAGCTPTGSAVTPATACSQANRPAITIAQFDIDKDVLIADAGTLFAGNGGPENQVCMSSTRSAPCAPLFASLGLSFNGSTPAAQTFFRRASSGVATTGSDK